MFLVLHHVRDLVVLRFVGFMDHPGRGEGTSRVNRRESAVEWASVFG